MDVEPNQHARVAHWLVEAAVGIEVIPVDQPSGFPTWWHVVVHNGLGGHEAAGTVVARCPSELEGELVAVALWTLVEKVRADASAENDARCPYDGQTLAWHQHTEIGPDGKPRTNAEFSGCNWPPTASVAMAALFRLFDQAFHTAGDVAGRSRAGHDYATVAYALGCLTPQLLDPEIPPGTPKSDDLERRDPADGSVGDA